MPHRLLPLTSTLCLMVTMTVVLGHPVPALAMPQVPLQPPPPVQRADRAAAATTAATETAAPQPESEPAQGSSLAEGTPKALALLAAGLGMVVYVSRRRHDD